MSKKIYYISQNNFNEKSHDLPNIYFKKNFEELQIYNYNEITNFIEKNNNKNTFLIFYNQDNIKMQDIYIQLSKYLNNFNNLKINIIFFLFDFWIIGHPFNDKLNKIIYNAKNYKIIMFPLIEELNFFHNNNYNLYKGNLITFPFWTSYNNSFINFNNNPLNKILVSGRITKHYPERNKIIKFNYTEILKYNMLDLNNNNNNYNNILNKYLCCFNSSVYVKQKNATKQYKINNLLLKTFEILASGSLLLMPLEDEKLLNKNGLYHNNNCYLIDLNKDDIFIQNEINYIMNINNRNEINKIRLNGQQFAKNNLNSEKKFNEFIKIINNIYD